MNYIPKKWSFIISLFLILQLSLGCWISPVALAVAPSLAVATSSGSAAFTSGDNAASIPVTIDPGLTVYNPDSTMLTSGTVAITSNFQAGEDVLTFINDGATMGNITASYDASTGVLTLTSIGASATLAQWQNALHSVTYTDSAVTPNTASRTISFSVYDGSVLSNTATRTVTVAAVDQTPIVTSSGGPTGFVAGGTLPSIPVVIDSSLTLSDLDNTTLASGTVAITGNYHSGEDILAFSNTNSSLYGNIVASYNAATGVLTLTSSGATATLAQWQSALRSVTYTDTAVTPNSATRTISFSVNDGVKTSSSTTKSITLTMATNQPPIVISSGGSTGFTAGDNVASTPVAIDPGLTVFDLDNTTLSSGTVAITGNFHSGEDVLTFTNSSSLLYGNIVASFNAATGVLTLTSSGATATLAQWQNALHSVTYTDSAVTPNTATRTISFSVHDGSVMSNTATRTVTVTAVDQTPIVTSSAGPTGFVIDGNMPSTPVAIDSGLTLADLDNTTLASGTATITGNFQAGEDVLAFTNDGTTMGNISAAYNVTTGVLTLTSAGATSTLAQWTSALRSIKYTNASATPNTSTRTISFSVNDGVKTSSSATKSITITMPINQPPIVTTSGGSTGFTAGDNVASTPVAIDSGLSVSDLDNTTLSSGIVAVTGNFQAGEDALAFMNDGATMGNITATYNASTGVLTLTSSGATATLAQWQNALRSVTYTNSSATPNASTRTISFSVNDGSANSSIATKGVTIKALTSISAAPQTINVTAGSTASTTITAHYSDLSETDVTSSVSWTVQTPAVASVSGGTIIGLKAGGTVLTAVYGTQTVNMNLTVTSSGSSGNWNPGPSTSPADPDPDPVTTPAEEASPFYGLVDLGHLIASIKNDLAAGNATAFQDTPSHWATSSITLAVRLGISSGYPDGTFRPDTSITRAEFSTMIVKALGLQAGGGTRAFQDTQNSWARNYIEILATNGVINGYPDGTFRPDNGITRSEMMAMISKILILDKTDVGKGKDFVDVEPNHWAYDIIKEASAAGIIQGRGQNQFAPDDNVTRAEAITVIIHVLTTEPTIRDLLL
ncbi:S-layer homology domain-containing protein [Gorillibacterium massiliense]|uniref:S-layer homology domain-containing protein n=1 Tax=Gorillibacterium massiliense TaxID=1280390 RepID=UPI0004B862D3|nr:S-layer homology domain-containing protein [Gorillibacterium massiliense]